MKAVVYDQYGGPEVLRITDVEKPIPGDGDILVKINAASINSADVRLMRADPFLARLNNGLTKPKKRILGLDIAGTVEAVGPGVTLHAVADAVFGDTFQDDLGGFAEYVCVNEKSVAKMPSDLSFEQAAAIPLAGITALQAVRDAAVIQPGQAVLIQGAGGGVGTYVVQIAKAYGATVTAVCGPNSRELVASLGADRILDYTVQDFTREEARYDVIFGINGYHSLPEYRNSLKPAGIYVMVGGKNKQIFDALLFGRFRFMFGRKRVVMLTVDDNKRQQDLTELCALLAADQLKPVIDRTFPIDDAVNAFRYVEEGHVRGKVILTIATA
ncbi:MAG: NAD(P)-dependent alcohol dehydrogenase [Caldilineaceae bacterium]|nr:NAD(P)-dependent alcohol dehydrogenase [Caldilineaceae bacterium]